MKFKKTMTANLSSSSSDDEDAVRYALAVGKESTTVLGSQDLRPTTFFFLLFLYILLFAPPPPHQPLRSTVCPAILAYYSVLRTCHSGMNDEMKMLAKYPYETSR